MNRQRIHEEVVELLCHKLPQLPLPSEEPLFDYDTQKLVPDVTANELDIAEIAMDIEDAFGIVLDQQLGSEELPTIGSISDYIHAQLAERS